MWTRWKSCANRMDAELLVGLLQSANITSRITSGDTGGMTPHLTVGDGYHVEILEDDQAAADELLEAGPIPPPEEEGDA